MSACAVDPLTRVDDGRYCDTRVVVTADAATDGVHARRQADGRIAVRHRLDVVDDDLAEALAAALAPLTDEHDVFARAFTGVVLTSDRDPRHAWTGFYRASLARVDDPHRSGYADVHRHALTLLPRTSVLDLGASFGFLALHLARLGVDVTAVEAQPGTAGLLRLMSRRLDVPLRVVVGDTLSLPDDVVDAVAMLHVLEHVDRETGDLLVKEAVRLARRRVVVAVPYEPHPIGLYGHVRPVRAADLHALGRASGVPYDVHDHLGGWLVCDLPVGRSHR